MQDLNIAHFYSSCMLHLLHTKKNWWLKFVWCISQHKRIILQYSRFLQDARIWINTKVYKTFIPHDICRGKCLNSYPYCCICSNVMYFCCWIMSLYLNIEFKIQYWTSVALEHTEALWSQKEFWKNFKASLFSIFSKTQSQFETFSKQDSYNCFKIHKWF